MNVNTIISNSKSERLQLLKAVFTIMILFIHSYAENINLVGGNIIFNSPEWLKYTKIIVSNVISMCSVSGFFFLSAFLLYRKPFLWWNNIIKKGKRLVIPYFIFNTFWIAVIFMAQHIPFLSGFFF